MKAAIITGAGSGIGEATAKLFAQNDYHVFLLGRKKDALAKTAAACPFHTVIPCDLTNPKDVDAATSQILSAKNLALEVLIQNAGIFARHSFADGSEDLWRQQFETNLFAPVRFTRALWPHFVKNQKGSIVMVSSTLGIKPAGGTSAYSASKAALNSLTQTLALEGGPHNIRVNCVAPGIVDTPIHDFHAMESSKKQTAIEGLNPLQPIGRIGSPQEIASAIYFLATEQSSWTTGSIFSVDGGIHLA